MKTKTLTTVQTFRANATAFSGQEGSWKFLVETDGTVRIYDDVAGHYTIHHGMTPRAEARVRNIARRMDSQQQERNIQSTTQMMSRRLP